MEYSTDEQEALDNGLLSSIHEWEFDGQVHRCWDHTFRASLAGIREHHRDAADDDDATDEELDELHAEMLDLGIITRSGLGEFTVHYGKIIQDGKVVPFDFMADDEDAGPPVPVLSHRELRKAAALIRRKLPVQMWGTMFALTLASGTDGTTMASHAAMAGLSHRHAHEYSMPEADLATIERVVPDLEALGVLITSGASG